MEAHGGRLREAAGKRAQTRERRRGVRLVEPPDGGGDERLGVVRRNLGGAVVLAACGEGMVEALERDAVQEMPEGAIPAHAAHGPGSEDGELLARRLAREAVEKARLDRDEHRQVLRVLRIEEVCRGD